MPKITHGGIIPGSNRSPGIFPTGVPSLRRANVIHRSPWLERTHFIRKWNDAYALRNVKRA